MGKSNICFYWVIVFTIYVLFLLFVKFEEKKELFSPLLEDDYPLTERQNCTNNSSSTVWKDYPVFKVGSYDQITNNIRYFRNPDIGTCSPEIFCGSLYKDKPHPKNSPQWLPPVTSKSCQARINYYNTSPNLLI
jgi:hypothetical protein